MYLALPVRAAKLPDTILTRWHVASFWKSHKPAQGLISSRAHVHPAGYLQAGNQQREVSSWYSPADICKLSQHSNSNINTPW